MEAFQQRVVDEKKELDGRIERLRLFVNEEIFNTLPLNERRLMGSQHELMRDYSVILGKRIAKF